MEKVTAACIQYTASNDWKKDVDTALELLNVAVGRGAAIAALPEVCAGIDTSGGLFRPSAFEESNHPALKEFCAFARENQIELVIGSIGVSADDGRVFNASFFVNAKGQPVARYDKIHLCDIDLPDRQVRESAAVAPGTKLVIVPTRAGKIGLSICYDLRFPQIYRRYAQAGATVMSIPAAFMRHTGKAHWHTLLRARAIETGSFVLAAGQCGEFEGGVPLFGHSMIIDPWGQVLAEAGEEPDVITAVIDPEHVWDARQRLPAWSHQLTDVAGRVELVCPAETDPVV
ncbi:carbon-nitrogen hydrolase family protein [Paraburkholderia sp. BL25I1N1]|uniref:carbon-nitrogen hydrolase family protein n=1 Tax=Paraburkholderia sp. BL25I1N1 TaxID=1938804 RepID=UPI000D07B298|nr:carbon-nitrogen hydrolase family protein [Paraburkholderia sp. BL25I1N1]PRX96460.1 putative amidohydrolase [Paraburkholderia sp. BL25I1N1]